MSDKETEKTITVFLYILLFYLIILHVDTLLEHPILIGLIALSIGFTYYRLVLKTKQEELSESREDLIQNADKLDSKISKFGRSKHVDHWEEQAAAIPKPGLSYSSQSTVQTRVEQLELKIERRRKVLRELEILLERHEIVVRACEHEVPPLQTHSIVQNVSQTDPESIDQSRSEIDLESIKTNIHAFHELKRRSEILNQIKTGDILNSITDSNSNSMDPEYLHALSESMAKLVTIEHNQPKIQITQGVEKLNKAIENPEEVSAAKGTITTLFQLLQYIERVENFLTDVDISHTPLTTTACEEQIESAISSSDPSRLDSLLTQIDQIVESSWELEDLYTYDWQSFEYLIGDLWASRGFETTVTAGTADAGIDVRAIQKARMGDHCIIQVKQYSRGNKVGRPDIQKTLGTLSTDVATRAIVVTSSSFTQPAITEAAKAGQQLELVNGTELLKLLSQSNIAPPIGEGENHRSQKYIPQYEPEQTLIELLQNQTAISRTKSDT